MKTNYKRTFWASILAFFIGTSCCWLSSLAVWFGGAAILGTITNFVEGIQGLLIGLGVILGITSLLLFFKNR